MKRAVATIIFCFLTGFLLTSAFLHFANAEEAYEVLTCCVSEGHYVNIRNQPRTNASKLGELHRNDTVVPEDISNGFVKFTYKGKTAYAKIDYFEVVPECYDNYRVVGNGRVRLRSSPNGERKGWINPGMEVKVIGFKYDDSGSLWGKVSGGYYISMDYLEIIGGE